MRIDGNDQEYRWLSAISGAFTMVLWLIPMMGVLMAFVAIGTGLKGVFSEENGLPLAGLTLGILGLILTLLRSGLVYYYG